MLYRLRQNGHKVYTYCFSFELRKENPTWLTLRFTFSVKVLIFSQMTRMLDILQVNRSCIFILVTLSQCAAKLSTQGDEHDRHSSRNVYKFNKLLITAVIAFITVNMFFLLYRIIVGCDLILSAVLMDLFPSMNEMRKSVIIHITSHHHASRNWK